MRADRLLSILMLLQTKGRMTAHDLADQLEVSERTIYRDLEALGMAGIPVYTERGPGGGCSLIDGYQTRLTGLTEAEVQALFLLNMAAPLADLGLGKALDDALLKLSAALPAPSREKAEQTRQRVHLDTTWWYHDNEVRSSFQTIQEAVWQDRKLCLVYQQDDGARSELLVEPYGLVAKADVWYLVGPYQRMLRVFRISRIQSAEMLEEQFIRPESFDLASYWNEYCVQSETNHPLYSLPLRLAPDEAPRLPQMLSEWGYTLLESDDALAVNGSGKRVIPFYRKEKKETASMQEDGQRENTLYVLHRTGEWSAVQPSEKKKNGFKPAHSSQSASRLQKKREFTGSSRTARPARAAQNKKKPASMATSTGKQSARPPQNGSHIKKVLYRTSKQKKAIHLKKSYLMPIKKTRLPLLTDAHATRLAKKTRLSPSAPLRSSIKKTDFATGYTRRPVEANKKKSVFVFPQPILQSLCA